MFLHFCVDAVHSIRLLVTNIGANAAPVYNLYTVYTECTQSRTYVPAAHLCVNIIVKYYEYVSHFSLKPPPTTYLPVFVC